MLSAVALVPAAGTSNRMGFDKITGPLSGLPLIVHTVRRLSLVPEIEQIVLAVQPGREEEIGRDIVAAYRLGKVSRVVSGGATRVHSVWNALQAITGAPDVVAVHDGARPFVTVSAVRASLAAAATHGGAIVATQVVPTIKRVGADGVVLETLNRAPLWAAATPQSFRYHEFADAYAQLWSAGAPVDVITDDAQIFERAGGSVTIVPGNPENVKLTQPLDWATAEWMIQTGRDGR
jgi:2-C-methyl-D-erythritol 4-phosphate cytidylyltransferase